jgi:hypothetical protein
MVECVGVAFGAEPVRLRLEQATILRSTTGFEFQEAARQAILDNRLHEFLGRRKSGGSKGENKGIPTKPVERQVTSEVARGGGSR